LLHCDNKTHTIVGWENNQKPIGLNNSNHHFHYLDSPFGQKHFGMSSPIVLSLGETKGWSIFLGSEKIEMGFGCHLDGYCG